MEYLNKVGCWVGGAFANTENTTNVNIWIKSIWCNSSNPQLGALLPKEAPKPWYPADRQWGTTTSGKAGFPSAWLGPILPPIRNWLVYWSIPPYNLPLLPPPQPPFPLIIGQPLWSVLCLSTVASLPPSSAHSAVGWDIRLTFLLQRMAAGGGLGDKGVLQIGNETVSPVETGWDN